MRLLAGIAAAASACTLFAAPAFAQAQAQAAGAPDMTIARAGSQAAGQVLIVTAGVGRVQRWGGPIQEIRPGDVVWTPPGVKHWHGAAPTTAMSHIAIQDAVNGKNVEWLEKVSDEQYGK
jgi:quercetin dioxygenase-like cupin family protein